MSILPPERNYTPLDFETRLHAVRRRVDSGWPIRKILSCYHVKRSSLYRWLKRYDGTEESLMDRSHRPKSPHPSRIDAGTEARILALCRRNPDATFCEIWARMRAGGSRISRSSVLRIMRRRGQYVPYKPCRKRHDKEYHTPKMVHEKWQVDVKYVPKECKAPGLDGKFYQYTILDECSRKRVLYFTKEHSMYETVMALEAARRSFGCLPEEIQTDNGFEFTDKARKSEGNPKESYLDRFCRENKIKHHLIRPRTPQHNGKVERSHRTDQDRFYRKLKFYSLEDLRIQGAAWNARYNRMPKEVLGFMSPNEYELAKLKELKENTGEIRCPKRLTSSDT